MEHEVFIPSSNRVSSVPALLEMEWGSPLTFVVPTSQLPDYSKVVGDGARVVGVTSQHVGWQRQFILELARARGVWCVQVDDDLVRIKIHGEVVAPKMAIGYMLDSMRGQEAVLAGIAPTDNAYFSKHEYRYKLFCRGNMTIMDPRAIKLNYDMALPLKGDYDMTCQAISNYGIALRCDMVLGTFKQRTNRGGCVDYRTDLLMDQCCAYLLRKWPQYFKLHATRPHEVSLRAR